MVIDLSPTGLDDVDIFTPDRFFDLYTSFADGELGEQDIGGWNTKMVTNGSCQTGMGATPNNDNVAYHCVLVRFGAIERSPIKSDCRTRKVMGL